MSVAAFATICGSALLLFDCCTTRPWGTAQYLDYLLHLNDENNTRVLFERALNAIPGDEAREVWRQLLSFETTCGDLQSMIKAEARRAAVDDTFSAHLLPRPLVAADFCCSAVFVCMLSSWSFTAQTPNVCLVPSPPRPHLCFRTDPRNLSSLLHRYRFVDLWPLPPQAMTALTRNERVLTDARAPDKTVNPRRKAAQQLPRPALDQVHHQSDSIP